MSIQEKELSTKDALPVCPHCNQDPASIVSREIKIGKYVALTVFCGNLQCRKMFNIELVGFNPQQQPLVKVPS